MGLHFLIFFSIFLCVSQHDAHATETYIDRFKSRSPLWQALDLQEQSLSNEIASRDLVVSTQLNLSAFNSTNDRQILTPSTLARYKANTLSAGLSKYLSTGTSLNFVTGVDAFSWRSSPETENHLSNMDISLSQNLWRDSFGNSDRIRRTTNDKEFETRALGLSVAKANLLIQFEDLYWTYAVSVEELRLREESLKIWIDLERWMNDRLRRAAAEIGDVKQVSATRTLREIQVQVLKQSIVSQKNEIDRAVEPGFADSLMPAAEVLSKPIQGISKLTGVVSLETKLLERNTEWSEQQAKKVSEDNKPDLKLVLAFGRTGLGSSDGDALSNSYQSTGDYTSIGLTFSTPLDFSLRSQSEEAARLKFHADRLRSENARRSNDLVWDTLQGRIAENEARLILLRKLTEDQKARNTAERRRFMNGRSNSLQMVTAEQDALDAELTLKTATADLRKLLARYYLFDLAAKDTP